MSDGKIDKLLEVLDLNITTEDLLFELIKKCIDTKRLKMSVGVHPIIETPAIDDDVEILDLISIDTYSNGSELTFKLNDDKYIIVALTPSDE